MEKKLLEKLKEKLEKEKTKIEEELRLFAKKSKKIPGDWETKFPKFDGEAGSSALETAAEEVEEFGTRLPLEYILEIRLKNIDLALKKIKKKKYGICEKCKKEIEVERLKAIPEARFCLNCQKK